MRKGIVNLILLGALILVVALFYFLKKGNGTEVISNAATIEKVQAIGKIELVKYQIKDILDYRKNRDYLPDSKVLLIVAGEITGCIDLKDLNKNNIRNISKNHIEIKLPKPEICMVKVDHEKSRVYDVQSLVFIDNEADMVDKAYKSAEKYLKSKNLTNSVLEACKQNAETILKPMLEQISGKKVTIIFKQR